MRIQVKLDSSIDGWLWRVVAQRRVIRNGSHETREGAIADAQYWIDTLRRANGSTWTSVL